MYESYINKIEDVGKLRNLKPKTITLYQKNVSRFLNYIQKNPEELTCEDARNYLLHLQGKGDKASTLNNNNGSLVFFYKRVLGACADMIGKLCHHKALSHFWGTYEKISSPFKQTVNEWCLNLKHRIIQPCH